MIERKKLSLESCVMACLPSYQEETWKIPFRLARKMKINGYVTENDMLYAIDLWWMRTAFYPRSGGRKDRAYGQVHPKDNFITKYRNASIYLNKPSVQPKLPAQYSIPHLWTQYTQQEIKVLLKETRDKRFNWDALDKVFQLCYLKGKMKERFYLSMNHQSMSSSVMQRNLKRLLKLGLIIRLKKGRKYDRGNIATDTTNIASEYSLILKRL